MVTVPASPPALERLLNLPDHLPGPELDWAAPIDRTRPFFCESLCPLYYTPVYRELGPDHQLRYNQLTGMLAVELISMLETDFLDAALAAVRSEDGPDSVLRAAVERFARDERRHAAVWTRLGRLSEPAWYAAASRHIVKVPAAAGWLLRIVARHPVLFPVVFWIQLAQEERSIEISRRCMRVPAGTIEPRFAAAFASHLKDEIRHVQIDRHLIDRFYASRTPIVRRMTARLFRAITKSFLLAPAHSTSRVVSILLGEYPELRALRPRIDRQLRDLADSDEYHLMMYSRATTPVTFSLFDRFEEFHQMQYVLRSYRPEGRA